MPIGGSDPRELEAEARLVAERYLAAVAGRDAAAGWSTLKPDGGAGRPNADAFREALASADVSTFAWQIDRVTCDDDICRVEVAFPNGWESVPSSLRYPFGPNPIPPYATFQRVGRDGLLDAGIMQVVVRSQRTSNGVMTNACCGG